MRAAIPIVLNFDSRGFSGFMIALYLDIEHDISIFSCHLAMIFKIMQYLSNTATITMFQSLSDFPKETTFVQNSQFCQKLPDLSKDLLYKSKSALELRSRGKVLDTLSE